MKTNMQGSNKEKKKVIIILAILFIIFLIVNGSSHKVRKNTKMNHQQRLQLTLNQKYPSIQRIEARIEMHDYQGAVEDCNELQLMEMDNKNPRLSTLCGKAKSRIGQYDEAIQDFDNVLKVMPNNKRAKFEKEKTQEMKRKSTFY